MRQLILQAYISIPYLNEPDEKKIVKNEKNGKVQ